MFRQLLSRRVGYFPRFGVLDRFLVEGTKVKSFPVITQKVRKRLNKYILSKLHLKFVASHELLEIHS